MSNNHMERYSASLVIREMRIKTIARHHFKPLGRLSSKNWTMTRLIEDVENRDLRTLLVGMEKGAAALEDILIILQKVKHDVTV